jgi:FkbM family methyltransferase
VLTRIFTRFYWISKRTSHKNLPGLGKALDLIKKEHVFTAKGRRYHFDPRVGRAYGLMIIGEWNEPETHTFLRDVLAVTEGQINFVNVGASIGEFVVDMAAYDKVAVVIAFEPQPESADAIERSCAVNRFQNVRIIRKIVTDSKGDLLFLQDRMSPTSSHVVRSIVHDLKPSQQISKIPGTTLDDELREVEGKTIILIDIEGEEYLAIRGGLDFIRKWKPLIIFEYNSISQASFDLNAVRDLLGSDYEIYRIRPDGRLDVDETNTWNMVAIARSSDVFNAVYSLQYEG